MKTYFYFPFVAKPIIKNIDKHIDYGQRVLYKNEKYIVHKVVTHIRTGNTWSDVFLTDIGSIIPTNPYIQIS